MAGALGERGVRGTSTAAAHGTGRARGLGELVDRLSSPCLGIALFAVAGGLISLATGIDVNWDLKNYHFYDAWALLNDRLQWDYAPAQLQSFYNPLLDLPFYAMVRAGTPAAVVTLLMGLPYGVALYCFFRLSLATVSDAGVARKPLALAAIGLLAVTAAAGLSVVGSTMNDWPASLPVIAALYLVVAQIRAPMDATFRAGAVAGLLVGAAVGLKLTAAPFALGVFACAALCLHGRRGHSAFAAGFAAAALAGFVVCYGYWATTLWNRFGNPFFPYFNGVFRSEWWDAVNFRDDRFLFKRLNVWITLPFKLAERNVWVTEGEMRDPRLAMLLLFCAVLAIATARRAHAAARPFGDVVRESIPPSVRALAVFAAVSYAIWLASFRIYRYAIPLELVACLLLVLAMRAALARAAYRDTLIATFVFAVVVATAVPDWGRMPLHMQPYFQVHVPPMPRNALVMIFTGEPVGYVVPFMDRSTRVVRPASNFTGPVHDNRLQREIDRLASTFDGPMYVMRFERAADAVEAMMLARYRARVVDRECKRVESNLEKDRVLEVCPVVRS